MKIESQLRQIRKKIEELQDELDTLFEEEALLLMEMEEDI